MTRTWIITVKFKPQKHHDPQNKKFGHCQTSWACTDSTGAHHCFLIKGTNLSLDRITKIVKEKYPHVHITRIEHAKYIEEVEL